MTRFAEDLLRAALSDAADTVTPRDLRPLGTPKPPPHRRLRMVPFGGAFLAAALAVAVLAAIAAPWSRRGEDAPRFSLASFVGAEYVLQGAWPGGGKTVNVRKADTGRTVATVPAPRGSSGFLEAAGAGDNRTFILTTADPRQCRIDFYRLILGDDGRPSPLTPLPKATLRAQLEEGPDLLAVAQGGREIAYASRKCEGPSDRAGTITVVDTATGERRVTGLPSRVHAHSLRWAPDGREIVFEIAGDLIDPGLRTLDTANGAIRPVSLGQGDVALRGAEFDRHGTNLVALVTSAGHNRLVWYSLTDQAVTREVPLGPSSPMEPTTFFVSGDKVVAVVGDRAYVVTGTTVRTQRVNKGGENWVW